MKVSRPRSRGNSLKVLVYEYVTGGGLAEQELPASWAAEGSAMRRAIATDFASVPDVEVVMPIDRRLPIEEHPRVAPWPVGSANSKDVKRLAAEVDYTVLIAPETDGILARLTETPGSSDRSLGSSRQAILWTGDKARLAHHFREAGIPTPETRIIDNPARELASIGDGLLVVKPRLGAGSVETQVVHDRRCPPWVTPGQTHVVQPCLPGTPMSASFLVDATGQATLLGVGRQRIEVDSAGTISYRGGTILAEVEAPSVVEQAVRSVINHLGIKSLFGFIGVDYLDDPRRGINVLEINPRPTTSYVGLIRLLGPGTIAGAWLDATRGPLAETPWPDRLRASRRGPMIAFEADGRLIFEEHAR